MSTRYVIVTAAKDEAALIGEVIERVVAQTVRPLAWIIVDDGSTDRTAEIVAASAARHPWIRLSSSGEREGRNFGSQYKAIQGGVAALRDLDFDVLAVQDADQAPGQANYYEQALRHLAATPRVGMVSGLVHERIGAGDWAPRSSNAADSTAGSAVFRRACFEGMGGYLPLVHGGSDWLAQLRARMAGWTVVTLPSLRLLHYRPSSSAGGLWRGRFREGVMDASFGSHPLFELLKCARRLAMRPVVVGAVLRLAGYVYGRLIRRAPALSAAEAAFLRREQVAKMRRWLGLGVDGSR
jgi:glycosyltransferase involved in cell wall biosynthesis